MKHDYKAFIQKRLRNKFLWTAIIALLMNMGLSGAIELPDNFEGVATSLLNVLVLLGIINNPSTQSQSLFIDENNDGIDDREQ